MQLSDKYKIVLWTVLSICVYYGGFYGMLILSLSGVQRHSIVTKFAPALLYLIIFPFVPLYISKKLKFSGHSKAASGIKMSIIFEIVPVILLIVYIIKKMGP
jgi:hypothetical protein